MSMMLMPIPSTLNVLQRLFTERSSTNKPVSLVPSIVSAKDYRCQIPALVSMILYGPNIETQSNHLSTPQAALTLSQLLVSFACCRNEPPTFLGTNKKERHPFHYI